MGKYQAYGNYKDSGVEWLGDIPKHWKRSLFKYYFDIQLGKMLQNESQSENDEEISYLKAIHVRWNKVDIEEEPPKMWASPKDKKKYYVQNGDLLICEGGEVGRTSLLNGLNESCIIQNALHRIRPSRQSSVEYLNYLMRHIADTKWFDILCNKSTIAHLTSEKLGALPFPFPPLEEQKKIARFLDYKTNQIDALIAKKEALLEKLDEKRTALISHAVTKGLDTNVSMKDSGIEWLGEIPEHWKAKRLKNVASCNDESLSEDCNPLYEIEYVDISSVDLVSGITHYENMIFDNAPSRARRKVRDGDTIISTVRTYLKAITAIQSPPDNLIVSTGFAVIRPKKLLDSQYIGYLLQSEGFIGDVVANSVGVSYPAINSTVLTRLPVVEPPLEEQREIAEYLDRKTAEIDGQKTKIKQAIALLKEYRTALITNSVTGKIDVRQVSISQP